MKLTKYKDTLATVIQILVRVWMVLWCIPCFIGCALIYVSTLIGTMDIKAANRSWNATVYGRY